MRGLAAYLPMMLSVFFLLSTINSLLLYILSDSIAQNMSGSVSRVLYLAPKMCSGHFRSVGIGQPKPKQIFGAGRRSFTLTDCYQPALLIGKRPTRWSLPGPGKGPN